MLNFSIFFFLNYLNYIRSGVFQKDNFVSRKKEGGKMEYLYWAADGDIYSFKTEERKQEGSV